MYVGDVYDGQSKESFNDTGNGIGSSKIHVGDCVNRQTFFCPGGGKECYCCFITRCYSTLDACLAHCK